MENRGSQSYDFKLFGTTGPSERNYIMPLPTISPKLDLSQLHNGRIIPIESIEFTRKMISQVIELGDVFYEQKDNVYIHKNLFPETAGIKHSFIRVGEADFVVIKENIGEGKRGNVILTQNLETGEILILKKIAIKHPKEVELIKKESATLQALDQSPTMQVKKKSKKNVEYGYIIMELKKGMELADIINEELLRDFTGEFLARPTISPLIRMQLGINILKAELDLIARGFLHLDLKPRNMMADLSNQLLSQIDFGDSTRMDQDKEVKLSFICGSDIYIATEIRALADAKPASIESKLKETPEIMSKPQKDSMVIYNEKTEVYALGISLAELFGLLDQELVNAYREKTIDQWGDITFVIQDPKSDYFLYNSSLPKPVLKEVLALIQEMTHNDPKERLSLEKSLERLTRIKETYFAKALVKVGVLNVEQFLASDETQKKELLAPFIEMRKVQDQNKNTWTERVIDEIILFDSSEKAKDPYTYLAVKREIEKMFQNETDDTLLLTVANEVVIADSESSLVKTVDKYLHQRTLPTTCMSYPKMVLTPQTRLD